MDGRDGRRGRRRAESIDNVSEWMGGMEGGKEEEQNGLIKCQNGLQGWKEKKKKN